MNEKNLTQGNILKNLVTFSLPFLLSSFLQTFYGLADLFITGQFHGSATITAVSVGSQITHMVTVIIVGLAMGSTVMIGRHIGAGHYRDAGKSIGNTVILFAVFAAFITALLLILNSAVLKLLAVPEEAFHEAKLYTGICFAGIPFITVYNVISAVFRGLGDSKRPMYFVAVAGAINIGLDYLFIGPFHMGAAGAALATVTAQIISVCIALFYMRFYMKDLPVAKGDFSANFPIIKEMLSVGLPIAAQDGFIQISFLVITVIANYRGVEVAAAVGIVEKVISFLFLVPSAMLSSVSAIAAQNAGASLHWRSKKTLYYAICIGVGYGAIVATICQFQAENIIKLFAKEDPQVVLMGAQYLKSYILDCMMASVHFCFSGFFCAYKKSIISFVHNVISVLLVRIPVAYLATKMFPDTLYPMGFSPGMGSTLSVIICVIVYNRMRKRLS